MNGYFGPGFEGMDQYQMSQNFHNMQEHFQRMMSGASASQGPTGKGKGKGKAKGKGQKATPIGARPNANAKRSDSESSSFNWNANSAEFVPQFATAGSACSSRPASEAGSESPSAKDQAPAAAESSPKLVTN